MESLQINLSRAVQEIRALIPRSALLSEMRKYRTGKGPSRIFGKAVRPLGPEEIKTLERQGNYSSDWSLIRVSSGFYTDRIRDSAFYGPCVLGKFDGIEKRISGRLRIPSGIYRSSLFSSEVGDNACIMHAHAVENILVSPGAVIFNAGLMQASGETRFGNGIRATIGAETGGREIPLFAEMSLSMATAAALNRRDAGLLERYETAAGHYAEGCRLPFGVLSGECVVLNTGTVRDAFIGSGVRLDGCAAIENCTLLGSGEEASFAGQGALIRDSCLQPGSSAKEGCIVEACVLMEHARAGRQAKLRHCVIGPYSQCESGEISSSLVGPLVAFHHQALLISALWPEGRGNVGYGANIGSNHTSRAPDQEIACGEGQFFGLGVNIKFPAHFGDAPYSIIATGVDTLPQRMGCPFSLISTPGPYPGIPAGANEIFPGWVYLHNMYMLQRNRLKFLERSVHGKEPLSSELFRPDLMIRVLSALKALKSVTETKEYYTDQDIPPIGKNVMTEKSRNEGIEAYEEAIAFYALRALVRRLSSGDAGGRTVQEIFRKGAGDLDWQAALPFCRHAGIDRQDPGKSLNHYREILKRILERTESSRAKDYKRGARIFPDYEEVHGALEKDPVLVSVRESTKKELKQTGELLAQLRREP